jgi:hypothetical protein
MRLGDVARLQGVTLAPCWRKQKNKSQGAAEAQLRALVRASYVKGAEELRTYLCRDCQTWHVGHVTKNCT